MSEAAELRETVKRLNRRTQEAEAALVDAKRCIDHLAAGHPWCGGNLGRALLAWRCTFLADMLAGIMAELDDNQPHAPGHHHDTFAVWDDDNGELSGKPCEWCALWSNARIAVEPIGTTAAEPGK